MLRIFSKPGNGPPPPVGNFPEIRRFWYIQASLSSSGHFSRCATLDYAPQHRIVKRTDVPSTEILRGIVRCPYREPECLGVTQWAILHIT